VRINISNISNDEVNNKDINNSSSLMGAQLGCF